MKPLLLLIAWCLSLMASLKAGEIPAYSILDEQGAKRIVTFYRRPSTDVTGYRTPTKKEVDDVETRLAKFFADTPRLSGQAPTDYFRQYCGIVVGGERRLYISFVRRAVVDAGPAETLQQPIIVHDGGSSFWRVDFDPHTQTFSHWQSNGTTE